MHLMPETLALYPLHTRVSSEKDLCGHSVEVILEGEETGRRKLVPRPWLERRWPGDDAKAFWEGNQNELLCIPPAPFSAPERV